MHGEHQTPAFPRPATQSSDPRQGNPSALPPPYPVNVKTGFTPKAPMLSASASNNHSLLSFGRNGDADPPPLEQFAVPHDFLPSVSFDDLQTSLESASTEFTLTQFPSPTGSGTILERSAIPDNKMPSRPGSTQAGAGTTRAQAPAPQPSGRPARSGSVVRRSTVSGRQQSISSINSSGSSSMEPPAAPAAMRNRRQSHYPPVSNAGNAGKQPRKSVGPGVLGDGLDPAAGKPRRRPSLMGDRAAPGSARRSVDMPSAPGQDPPRPWNSTRATKAKSVQPSPRNNPAHLSAGEPLAPEPNRLSAVVPPRSPQGGHGGSTPSSAGKRASMMPGGYSSHAHGLGARTISPTDTRRAKRMSTMPTSQSLNQVISVPPPPPPVSMDTRAESRSPSMIPRRTSGTPSSARTTPDPNRKSYNSSLSVGSSMSYNAPRTSSSSTQQPRGGLKAAASRLPAPKHTTAHNPMTADDGEEVPPVPAIPKAYESPKGSPADGLPADGLFVERKKTGFNGLDATSVHSNSTGSISMPVHPEPTKLQRKRSARKSAFVPGADTKADKPSMPSDKKNAQPLSLPPINLGPLNIPNLDKASSRGTSALDRDLSPPPSRQLPKTPTTPLTASRSAFFSKNRFDDTMELPVLRSSSSVHVAHRSTPGSQGGSSTDSSPLIKDVDSEHKPTISPFLSSSVPKSGFDSSFIQRPKTGGDYPSLTGAVVDDSIHQKPAGPRPPKPNKPVPVPSTLQDTDEPPTPSSMSSLRRKLSMSWKRDKSKGSNASAVDISEKGAGPQQQQQQQPPPPQPPTKEDGMPPPRIPVSATVGNLANIAEPNPNHSVRANGGYLESRRRKGSTGSLGSFAAPDRTKGDNWGPKKESVDPSTMPSSRNHSVMNKFLKSKSSSHSMRSGDPWAAELDKDDLAAEDEMKKMGSRRKETEVAARTIDALRKRATPKERVGPHEAIRIAMLNIYERGEIIDYKDVYFCGTQGAPKVVGDLQSDAPNFGYDDDRGDYTIVPGDHLAYRYEIVDVLGKGSFGQVVRCIDHKLGVLVAIKIIRNKKRFHQQALVEVNILQKLREWDPHNKHSMVNFTQSFYFRGHLCISTELLDMNLYEFIKVHAFRGFSLRIIRRFTKQILSSLSVLQQKKVIHCDLKPENILLRHPLHSEIKVIDFGSSCFESEKVYTYIQSRFYRSPEVILGMSYGMPIDMWSVGCILAELYTGVPIFPGENEQEQLACIMEVFGPPEKHLIEKSSRKKLFFDSMGKPRLTVSSKGRRRRPSSKTLQQVLKCDDEAFLDFLARCLRWDPDRRMRPEDAIRHEFITGRKSLPRMPKRDASPVKRHNTVSVPRPLPDPPAAGSKAGGAGVGAGRTGGPSPHKPVSISHRRASGVTAPTAASSAKRTSTGNSATGGMLAGASNLPRAAGRTASGKHDVAAAGATAAMTRRG